MTFDSFVTQFRQTVERAATALGRLDDAAASRRRAPGKWSSKEVLGHLIDSASNNHGRFVRAALTDDLLFQGYDQDGWVAAQRYQDASWPDLINLWRAYNLELARVMLAIPDEARRKPRARHNLDQIAGQPVSPGQAATLDYFMRDYVRHMEHHLRQILPD